MSITIRAKVKDSGETIIYPVEGTKCYLYDPDNQYTYVVEKDSFTGKLITEGLREQLELINLKTSP